MPFAADQEMVVDRDAERFGSLLVQGKSTYAFTVDGGQRSCRNLIEQKAWDSKGGDR
jgi:hypothetical protein